LGPATANDLAPKCVTVGLTTRSSVLVIVLDVLNVLLQAKQENDPDRPLSVAILLVVVDSAKKLPVRLHTIVIIIVVVV